MQSKHTPPPKSNTTPTIPQTTLSPSSPPDLPTPTTTFQVTHFTSPPPHSSAVPDPLQQQLDLIQLSINMKSESLATTFPQRFDQTFRTLPLIFSISYTSSNSIVAPAIYTLHFSHTTSPSYTPFDVPLPFPLWSIPATLHVRSTRPLSTARSPAFLDAPKFDGQDSAGWIFGVEEYFEFYSIPHMDRLSLVGLFFEGQASKWFRWMRGNSLLHSWEDFLQQLCLQFDPDHFEDYVGALSKLRQSTTVLAYQSKFELLLNKITGVPEPTLISVFVSDLKPHTRRELNLRQPSSLTIAFTLARELSA